MSTRETVTITYVCDLCQAEGEEGTMARVFSEAPRAGNSAIHADICTACQERPIRDLVAAIRRAEEAAGVYKVRVQAARCGTRSA